MKKIFFVALTIVIITTILSGCGKNDNKNLEKITMTYVTSPLNVPSIIDKENQVFVDKFKEDGISVEYAEILSGADQTQALASGDVQILYAVGASSVILSAANDADIKILNTYSRSPEAFTIYSKDDKIKSPKDLVGKTIAGPAGTNLHELLVAYLEKENLTINDVNYVNMSIGDAKAGLDGGSVDVALLAGVSAYNAKQQGYNLVTDGKGLIDAIIVVALKQEFYDNNKEVVDKFYTYQQELNQYINDNVDESLSIVAKNLDLEESAVKEMYSQYDFSLDITEQDKLGLQKTADFMFKNGMIDKEIDINTLFLK